MSAEVASGEFEEDEHSLVQAIPALDLVVAELKPLAVSLLLVGTDGAVRCRAARAPGLVGDPCRELGNWHRRLGARAPLASGAIAGIDRRVVTFADLGEARSVLLDDPGLLAAYRAIGAIDDTRVLIRDGRRLKAMIAVWRPLQSLPWREEELRRLEVLQPLVEMAWPAAPHPGPRRALPRLPIADLTPRQREVAALLAAGATNREVARALGISGNTVKTHARAVLGKLGAGSRQELMLAPRGAPASS